MVSWQILLRRLQNVYANGSTGCSLRENRPAAFWRCGDSLCRVWDAPFVHLDPAMPHDVLRNIIDELGIDVIFFTPSRPRQGNCHKSCACFDVAALAQNLNDQPARPRRRSTSSARLTSFISWRRLARLGNQSVFPVTQNLCVFCPMNGVDAYTPYGPDDRVGCLYLCDLGKCFRPLRKRCHHLLCPIQRTDEPA